MRAVAKRLKGSGAQGRFGAQLTIIPKKEGGGGGVQREYVQIGDERHIRVLQDRVGQRVQDFGADEALYTSASSPSTDTRRSSKQNGGSNPNNPFQRRPVLGAG